MLSFLCYDFSIYNLFFIPSYNYFLLVLAGVGFLLPGRNLMKPCVPLWSRVLPVHSLCSCGVVVLLHTLFSHLYLRWMWACFNCSVQYTSKIANVSAIPCSFITVHTQFADLSFCWTYWCYTAGGGNGELLGRRIRGLEHTPTYFTEQITEN
jgi:hypothetical protein